MCRDPLHLQTAAPCSHEPSGKLAVRQAKESSDYVAFGLFCAEGTRPDAEDVLDPSILKLSSKTEMPREEKGPCPFADRQKQH